MENHSGCINDALQLIGLAAGELDMNALDHGIDIEWQGVDTLALILEMGELIQHVHAKDSKIYARNASIHGTLDPKPYHDELERAWNFRTVGWGHGPEYWKEFVLNLRMVGYDYVLSIEHEDSLMSAGEGLDQAVRFLNTVLLKEEPGPMTWA